MTTLESAGISVELPNGWEGGVRTRVDPAPVAPGVQLASTGHSAATAHMANFALPSDRADFGGGAVELMNSNHIFMSLVEFDADSAGTALFADQGVPQLSTIDFDPYALQRVIHGQCGLQRFFTVAGRPFCLYVVLGREDNRGPLVSQCNAVLRSLRIT
ncbi:hypothetical protein [Actinomarinicola tropica]|uniref:Uncharacterized protein n=1 Tax=Actinomarinicola tropica TaxID=2789776 RepID=A0A5Q2RIR5_9ACTN|nr:hypothetical protein [Actinomarinicola tropica]QGG96669.1 hypothetical protein GH723_17060 [Actinomarinicola tropica]